MGHSTQPASGLDKLQAVPIAQAQQWADSSVNTMRAHTCKACHAPLIWPGHHVSGKLMPVDRRPDPSGKIYFVDYELVAIILKNEEIPAEIPRFKSHFATCPYADRFRK